MVHPVTSGKSLAQSWKSCPVLGRTTHFLILHMGLQLGLLEQITVDRVTDKNKYLILTVLKSGRSKIKGLADAVSGCRPPTSCTLTWWKETPQCLLRSHGELSLEPGANVTSWGRMSLLTVDITSFRREVQVQGCWAMTVRGLSHVCIASYFSCVSRQPPTRLVTSPTTPLGAPNCSLPSLSASYLSDRLEATRQNPAQPTPPWAMRRMSPVCSSDPSARGLRGRPSSLSSVITIFSLTSASAFSSASRFAKDIPSLKHQQSKSYTPKALLRSSLLRSCRKTGLHCGPHSASSSPFFNPLSLGSSLSCSSFLIIW